MKLEEIKAAVLAGKTVHWSNPGYCVIRDKIGSWLIVCAHNHHCIGLTHADEVTLNGKEEDFFIAQDHTANLKRILMQLGNRLVTEHQYDPGHVSRKTIDAVNGRRSTEVITLFTEWLNHSEEARQSLQELGFDWPIVSNDILQTRNFS